MIFQFTNWVVQCLSVIVYSNQGLCINTMTHTHGWLVLHESVKFDLAKVTAPQDANDYTIHNLHSLDTRICIQYLAQAAIPRNVQVASPQFSDVRQLHRKCGSPVAYFDHIAAFKVLYRWTSVKGAAHMCFVDLLDIHASKKHVWAPPLTEVQWMVLQTQRCNRNTRRNNLRFLHVTATYVFSYQPQ